MSSEINNDISKCPFHGEGIPQKHNSGKGQTNRDWWPNSLNLKILSGKMLALTTSLLVIFVAIRMGFKIF